MHASIPKTKQQHKNWCRIGCHSKLFFIRCSFRALDPANDRKVLGDSDSWAEMSVLVRDGDLIIKTL